MESTKQPNIFRRHRNRGPGERQPKKPNRESGRRFYWSSTREAKKRHTKRPAAVVRAERRARNKRARASRKANR